MSSTTLDRSKLVQKLLRQLSNKSLEPKLSNQFPLLTCEYLGGTLNILILNPKEIKVHFETAIDSFGGVVLIPPSCTSLAQALDITINDVDEALVKQAQIEVQNESTRFH